MSSVVQLELSDARVKWLATRGKLGGAQVKVDECRGTVALPDDAKVVVPWLLLRDAVSGRWRVYYDPSKLPAIPEATPKSVADYDAALASARSRIQVKAVQGMTPVLALTNPYPAYRTPADYFKNALTGDFDLFAVWPRRAKAADFMVRVGGMGGGDVKQEKAAIYKAEAADLIGSTSGNMSSGVYDIAMRLNMESQTIAGQSEVNRVFHSDEGGRPGMDSVDESVAFIGETGSTVLLKDPGGNAKALAPFALACARQGYAIFLNTGWVAAIKGVLGPTAWAELEKAVMQQRAQAPATAPSAAPPAAATATKKV